MLITKCEFISKFNFKGSLVVTVLAVYLICVGVDIIFTGKYVFYEEINNTISD